MLIADVLIPLIIIGVLAYAVIALIARGQGSQTVRRAELKKARTRAVRAASLLTEIESMALTNLEFQPHLAGAILTSITKWRQEEQQRELS